MLRDSLDARLETPSGTEDTSSTPEEPLPEECPPCSAYPQPELRATPAELQSMLDLLENQILPYTTKSVAEGNKMFGAAVLTSELKPVIFDTNHETLNPLFHGEIYTLNKWAELKTKPPPADSVFLCTHEPCCLCISAITWAGFKKQFFFFTYQSTAAQGIPHDLDIMYELWRVPRYNMRNKFIASAGILDLISQLPEGEAKASMEAQCDRIKKWYEQLAAQYHAEKAENPNNTMAFN